MWPPFPVLWQITLPQCFSKATPTVFSLEFLFKKIVVRPVRSPHSSFSIHVGPLQNTRMPASCSQVSRGHEARGGNSSVPQRTQVVCPLIILSIRRHPVCPGPLVRTFGVFLKHSDSRVSPLDTDHWARRKDWAAPRSFQCASEFKDH